MPVISEDLRPFILPRLGATPPKNPANMWEYKKDLYLNGNHFDIVLKAIVENPRVEERFSNPFYTISYVIAEETKSYANKSKQMTKIRLDTGGTFSDNVVWPNYGENIAESGFKNRICKVGWKYNSKRNEFGIKTIEILKT